MEDYKDLHFVSCNRSVYTDQKGRQFYYGVTWYSNYILFWGPIRNPTIYEALNTAYKNYHDRVIKDIDNIDDNLTQSLQ